jgi:transposase InsO family protein
LRILYCFVVLGHDRRQVVHFNVTAHPTEQWTVQQVIEAFPYDQAPQYLLRDRDGIYGDFFRGRVKGMGIREVRISPRSPGQNSYCERLIGSLRRGCLDFLIPLSESHLRRIVKDWQIPYNQARLHSSLGPGLPAPRPGLPVPLEEQRHQIPTGYPVRAQPILGGLHHEYRLEKIAA